MENANEGSSRAARMFALLTFSAGSVGIVWTFWPRSYRLVRAKVDEAWTAPQGHGTNARVSYAVSGRDISALVRFHSDRIYGGDVVTIQYASSDPSRPREVPGAAHAAWTFAVAIVCAGLVIWSSWVLWSGRRLRATS